MDYMLMFQETAADFAQRNDPAAAPAYWAGWQAYIGSLYAAGIVQSGAGLQPPHTATTVRLRGGERQVQDGPFAETHEMLAGFMIIRVESLDEALGWAARSPAALMGAVEVRPVMPPPPNMPTA
jgi:hypothetical protein